MKTLALLTVAATLAMCAAPAVAADMPEWSAPPPEVADTACAAGSFHRQVDDVWQPPQVAYILAARCDDKRGWFRDSNNLLVYYNGGSWDQTDIRILRAR